MPIPAPIATPVPPPSTLPQWQSNYSLRELNTLGLAVRSRCYLRVDNQAQLREALDYAAQQQLPVLVLGGGSNLVLSDDFPGLCIHIDFRGIEAEVLDEHWVKVRVQAGEAWHPFVSHCLDQGWYGLENLALIPGTVGAAPIQNIGAYGVEIKDYLLELQALDRQTLRLERFDLSSCQFGYRESVFKGRHRDRYIICSVTFKLRRQPKLTLHYGGLAEELAGIQAPTPRHLFDAVVRVRSQKLPDPQQLPNAGSFFKNPLIGEDQFQTLKQRYPQIVAYPDAAGVKLAAGWLIDQAGWKGYRQGDVGVHVKQALVLVNYGAASGHQVLELAARIQADIRQRYGIELEIEPRVY